MHVAPREACQSGLVQLAASGQEFHKGRQQASCPSSKPSRQDVPEGRPCEARVLLQKMVRQACGVAMRQPRVASPQQQQRHTMAEAARQPNRGENCPNTKVARPQAKKGAHSARARWAKGLLGCSGPHPWLFGARPRRGQVRCASEVLGPHPGCLCSFLWQAGGRHEQALRFSTAAEAPARQPSPGPSPWLLNLLWQCTRHRTQSRRPGSTLHLALRSTVSQGRLLESLWAHPQLAKAQWPETR